MDNTRIDRGASVCCYSQPNGVTGDQQEVVEPEGLLGSNCQPGEVVDVSGALRGLDDRVVPNCPEEHAG
eukprot:9843137-Lingulodinium_polyedra.AAC.1